MDIVLQLWILVLQKGYDVRKAKLDGYAEWQLLKAQFSTIPSPQFPVNDIIIKIIENCYTVLDDDEDHAFAKFEFADISLNNKKVTDHFFIQHFRIPYMEKYQLNLVKLLQIAYNVGQFKAAAEMRSYDDSVVNFYKWNNLDDIRTFITFNL